MDVSIVIPLFNRKDYIERTVESILNSGVAFQQLIIVDNWSTDGSLELANTIPSRFGCQIIVVQETKPGAAAARNKGLSLCKTKWVYFFDSDDIFTGLPGTWDEDADMVCFPTFNDFNGKKKRRAFICNARPHVHILSLMLNTQGVIFNAEFLRGIGGWDERCLVWDDWELGIRGLTHAGNVCLLPDKAYHEILIHPDSITGADFSSRSEGIARALEIAWEDVSDIRDLAEKSRSEMALFYRVCILCGFYLREGNKLLAAETIGRFSERFNTCKECVFIGRILTWYVALGGRGAWRIAMRMI